MLSNAKTVIAASSARSQRQTVGTQRGAERRGRLALANRAERSSANGTIPYASAVATKRTLAINKST